jgi:TP901 family phage tail tape measure protein
MARQAKGITLPIIYKADMGGLNQATRGLQGFGRIAGQVALLAGAALAGIAVGGIRMATNLETSFAKIQGLVGLTADEVDVLREAAKRLGPQFGQSANDAADALFFITSAGLRGNDAIETLEASLKGAAIGLGDLNTIADLATSAMNAYGPEVLSASKAVDVLAEAVRLGKLEPAELAGSMGQVLPIASAMGISFAEVGAAMAAMSRTGTDASSAATQLRGIMTSILKPTTEAERALRDVGTSSDELRKSIRERGLLVTLQDLTQRFDGNEEATAKVFGNVRALSGVLDLFGANAEGTMEILAEMTDEVGVLDEAFLIMEDTVGFKAARAFEGIKSVMLEVGDALLPLVSEILDGLIPAISDLSVKAKEFIDTKLVPFINDLRGNQEFQDFLANLGDTIAGLVEPAAKVAINVGKIAIALSPLLKGALDASLPVLEDLASILGNLSDIFVILTPRLNGSAESADRLSEFLKTLFSRATMGFNLGAALKLIADELERLREFLEKNEDRIQEFYTNLGNGMDDPAGKLKTVMDGLLIDFDVFFGGVFRSTQKGVDDLNKPFQSGGPKIQNSSAGFLNMALRGMQNVWPNITGWFNTSVSGLPPIVDRIRGAMSNSGSGVMSSLWSGLQNVWGNVRNWINGRVGDIRNAFGSINLNNIGKGIMSGLLNGLNAGWGNVWSRVRQMANQIIDEFKRAMKIGSPSKVFFEFGENIVEGLVGGMDNMSPKVDASVSGIVPSVPSLSGSTGAGGATYSITVNAGMGTDGAEVGRKVVEVIRQYERRSGKVFAAA